MVYRISYIVEDDTSPGIITTQDHLPSIGDSVSLGIGNFTIIDVCEIMPAKDGTQFLVVILKEQSQKALK